MEDLVIEDSAASALEITLGDFLMFINWMNQAEKSLDRAASLPTLPSLDSAKVRGWIQLVQRLEERFRRSEEEVGDGSQCDRTGSATWPVTLPSARKYRFPL